MHHIYLDCDQVLTDFVAAALAAVGRPYPGTRNWPPTWEYNFFTAAGTTRQEVDEHCDINFWACMPWMEDGRELLAAVLARFSPKEVTVLTKPMRNPGSYTGKMLWFEKNCPELYDRVVPTLVPKEEFAAGFGSVLIDDSQANIEAFTNAGGAGILVPRPYNDLDKVFHAGDAVNRVADLMDMWINLWDHPAKLRKGTSACQK